MDESLDQKIGKSFVKDDLIPTGKYVAKILAESTITGLMFYYASNNLEKSVVAGSIYGMSRLMFDGIDCYFFRTGRLYDLAVSKPKNLE